MTSMLQPPPNGWDIVSIVRQLKVLAKRLDPECDCSSAVGEVLTRVAPAERKSIVQELFHLAVRQRVKVATLIDLTMGLEELDPHAEKGELEEAAMLFDDMAEQARLGSQLLKAVAFGSLSGTESGIQASRTEGSGR